MNESGVNIESGMSTYKAMREDTWRDRLRRKLFPVTPCEIPTVPNPADFEDVLHVIVKTEFTWSGRFMLLLTGRLEITAKVLCQNECGNTKSQVAVNVKPWRWLE